MKESRLKAQQTMIARYGVNYTLESPELREQVIRTTMSRYGVKNIQQSAEFKQQMYETIRQHQRSLLPLKIHRPEIVPPFMKVDDASLQIYKLKEQASQQFLIRYGFNQQNKFGRYHLSFGLVSDNILYQVIRFERHKDMIHLTDFGTREGFYITNYYQKLIKFATTVFGIDSFTTVIPRYIAQDNKLIHSLNVQFIEEQYYDVYWIMEDRIKKMTLWDKSEEMLSRYDYFTTDYKEVYKFG